MTSAVRATRDVPRGAWLALPDLGLPASGAARAPSARRLAWEAGPSGLDGVARHRLAPPPSPRHPLRLAGSAATHALLAAALLLAATPARLPEQDQAAIPLVFEPAPLVPALAPGPLAPDLAAPATPPLPAVPSPEPPPLAPEPTQPIAEPPAAAPPPPVALSAGPATTLAPALAAPTPPAPPRLRTPPATRPVPRLAPPAAPRPAPPASRTAPARAEAAPVPAQGDAPPVRAEAPPSAVATRPAAGPTVSARPLAGAPGNVQPAYPEQARRRGIEGRVVIRAIVSPEGRTASASVAQGSGSDALDHAALDAVRGYRFSPALRGGTPVEGTADLPFTFRLAE